MAISLPPDSSQPNSPKPNKLPGNFDVLIFKVACPACGATIEFASAGSVMAVCEYCQTTVLRQGDTVTAQGKQSFTVEDYSPLQIGSIGNYGQVNFAVVGRIQFAYSDGIWNEWYLQFADGRNGWLSEALGLYSISFDQGKQSLPSYNQLTVNQSFVYNGVSYVVTDRREATAIAGEGELPMVVGKGWQTWTIDARSKQQLITLDYTKTGIAGLPYVSAGQAVALSDLSMQLLKDSHQINQNVAIGDAQASSLSDLSISDNTKPTSQIHSLNCPNCASPVPYVVGATHFLVCPSCHTEIALTGNTAEVLQTHAMMQAFPTSLPLGAKARIIESDLAEVSEFSHTTINNHQLLTTHDYVVIGIQRLLEVGENVTWTEYLLYSFTNGFLWLSEESSGWYLARVLNEQPIKQHGGIVYDDKLWRSDDDEGYQSQVVAAIGAFNWRVSLNDTMWLKDFTHGQQLITSEQNSQEITYTLATPVTHGQLRQWFGEQLTSDEPNHSPHHNETERASMGHLIWLIVAIGFIYIVLFFPSGGAFAFSIVTIVIGLIIYAIMSSQTHRYESQQNVFVKIFTLKNTTTIIVNMILIILSVILNIIFFGIHNISNGNSSSGGTYYSSGSRGGYTSSSSSHK